MEKSDDSEKEIWQRRKEAAILLGEAWAKAYVAKYEEPQRAGKKKGIAIGFSREKKLAAAFSVLHPMRPITELAKNAKTTAGTLRVWRTQPDFRAEEERVFKSFSQQMSNTIVNLIEKKKPEEELKPALQITGQLFEPNPLPMVINILPFFHHQVYNSIAAFLLKRWQYGENTGFLQIFDFMMEASYFKQDKSLRNWRKNPLRIETNKNLIAVFILTLADPKMRKSLSEQEFSDFVQRTIKFVWHEIDFLAK